jgi:hypothetical protein
LQTAHGPRGGQTLKQTPPVVYHLAPGNFQRGQARLLKALIGIGPIAISR